MSRIRILVCKVEDEDNDNMSEIASFDLPEMNLETLNPLTALDDLEASTLDIGNKALKKVLQARWEEMDKQLVEKHRQAFPPSHL